MEVVCAGFAVRAASPPTSSLPFGLPNKERNRNIGEWAFYPEVGHQPGKSTKVVWVAGDEPIGFLPEFEFRGGAT